MDVIALLAVYNGQRTIGACIENLLGQNLKVYLIDNESTDETLFIAKQFLPHGVIGYESYPNPGWFDCEGILKRKENLSKTLDADWFLHVDADEIKLAPRGGKTLVDTIKIVDEQGYNAINFVEFTFLPTREEPHHDHPSFIKTMQYYYQFGPRYPCRINGWKKQSPEVTVEMRDSGGHLISFSNQRLYPEPFILKHYICLSLDHLKKKYLERVYPLDKLRKGWHGWRACLKLQKFEFPSRDQLRLFTSNCNLIHSDPWRQHYFESYRLGDPRRM